MSALMVFVAVLAVEAMPATITTGSPSADIAPSPSGDDMVNFLDFAILAGEWMQSM